jgi:hypothetical protein
MCSGQIARRRAFVRLGHGRFVVRLTLSLIVVAFCAQLPTPVAAFQVDPQASAAEPKLAEPGSELRVWLVTAGPGDAVWERFGHNAIRVLNTETGRDVAYNWGIFDFTQTDFVPRFLKGEMLYMMAPYPMGPMVDSYARAGREMIMQELALTASQRQKLSDLAEINARPENREYFYDYFGDNCSTRVRDLLNEVLGGSLYDQLGVRDNDASFRTHTRRLTQVDPLVFTGMDVLLGSPGDVPIVLWDEMFIPMVLRDAIRDATVTDAAGNELPLALSEEVVLESARVPEPARATSWFWRYLLLGAMAGGLLAWLGSKSATGGRLCRVVFGALCAVWSLVAGLFGLLLVLVLFTDHWSMAWNETLFLTNPLSLTLMVLAPMALMGGAASRQRANRVGKGIIAFALFGLVLQWLPATPQATGMLFALFLPIHMGVGFGLSRLAAADSEA